MTNPALDAFSVDPGVDAGRIQPSGVTPTGAYVFCLGHDEPGFTSFLKPGDYVEISQTATVPSVNLLTFVARTRSPATIPAGYAWTAALFIDGTSVASRPITSATPIDWEWAYDLTALEGASHTIAFRLTFSGPVLPGPPASPIIEVEIPAFYIDALTFSAGTGGLITNEVPVANQGISDGAPPADGTAIDFDIFGEGTSVDPSTIHVTINGAPAIVGGAAQAGFSATIGSSTEVVHVHLTPTTPFASNELVTVVASSGVPAPHLISMTPNVGLIAGGTTVTITGHNLLASAFALAHDGDSIPITILTNDGSTVTGTTGAYAFPVLADLVVTSAGGTDTLSGEFTYEMPTPLWSFDFTKLPVGTATIPTDPVAGAFTVLRATANTVADPLHTVQIGMGDTVTGIAANIPLIGRWSDSDDSKGLVTDHASTTNGYPSNIPAPSGGGGWGFVTATGGQDAPDGSQTATAFSVPDHSSYNAFWLEGAMQSNSVWSFYYANNATFASPAPGPQSPMFINLDTRGMKVEPFDVPIFNGNPIWHRFEQYVANATALTFDQRAGATEPSLAPLSVVTWGFQVEPGKIATELIPNTSLSASASRQGQENRIANGAAIFPGGRLHLNIELSGAKGDASDFGRDIMLLIDPNDLSTFIKINTSRKLVVSVKGNVWTSPRVLAFKKNIPANFIVSLGAGVSAASYRSGNRPLVGLGQSMASYPALAPSSYVNVLCSGTASQFTSRCRRIEGYPTADTNWSLAPQATPQNVHIVADGDSITRGFGLANPRTQGYVGLLEAFLGRKVGKIINLGVSGEAIAASPGLLSKYPTYASPLYDAFPVEIYSSNAGTNDLANGSVDPHTIYANYTSLVHLAQADGFAVPMWTMMDRNTGSTPQGTFDTNRATWNSLVIANTAGADFIIDLTVDSNLSAVGAKNNLVYFQSGGIHPTGGPAASGCASIVAIAGPAFATFISSLGY